MNKGFKITLIVILLIIFGGVGGYFFLKTDANKKAKEFYDEIKIYTLSDTELKTGVYLDFSKDKNPVTKANITEGIVFVDEDNDVRFYSNIKINGFYCSLNEGVTNCDLSNKKDTNVSYEITNKEYKVGDAVTLINGTKWHVINDSSIYSRYVTLILDQRVDINGDGFTMDLGTVNDPDRIPFDKSGSKVYDVNKEGNIGYYLENNYRKIIDQGGVIEIRIPTFDEIEKIKEVIGFEMLSDSEKTSMLNAEEAVYDLIGLGHDENAVPYYSAKEIPSNLQSKLMPHWLFNSYSGNYWVIKNGGISTAVWDGNGYISKKPTTGASLKPIITIEKTSVLN